MSIGRSVLFKKYLRLISDPYAHTAFSPVTGIPNPHNSAVARDALAPATIHPITLDTSYITTLLGIASRNRRTRVPVSPRRVVINPFAAIHLSLPQLRSMISNRKRGAVRCHPNVEVHPCLRWQQRATSNGHYNSCDSDLFFIIHHTTSLFEQRYISKAPICFQLFNLND